MPSVTINHRGIISNKGPLAIAALLAILLTGVRPVSAQKTHTIYAEDFAGQASRHLDGVAPHVDHGPSATWTAGSQNVPGNGKGAGGGWWANGHTKVGNALGEAYLSFTPHPGHIYTLSANIKIQSDPVAPYYSLQMGFIGNPGTRSDLDQSSGYAFVTISQHPYALLWTNPKLVFSQPPDKPGTNTVSIVLNTAGPQWTCNFILNGKSYGPATFKANPSIKAVGLGNTGGNVSGTFSKFSLTESGNHLRARAAKLVKSAK